MGTFAGNLASNLAGNWTGAWQSVWLAPLNDWLAAHPLVAWLVGHPLWALGLAGLGVLLLAGLWSAIARLTEGFWLALVSLPWRLAVWLVAGLMQLVGSRWRSSEMASEGGDRLREIMGRLETLQTEQETLLAEMRQLLAERR